jgi:hypothetical protein
MSLLVVSGLILYLGSPVVLSKLVNTDLWKNLVTGRYLYHFGMFPHYSTFSYLPVKDLVLGDSVDWLGSLSLYFIYHKTGYVGLNLLKILPVLIGFIILFVLNDCELTPFLVFSSLIFVYGVSQRMIVRTSLFGLCLLPLVLYVWRRGIYGDDRRVLWLIPVLMVVWSNLHGSYWVGLFVLVGLFFGFLAELVLFDSLFSKQLFVVLLVLLVTLSSVLYVKPYPDFSLQKRMLRSANLVTSVVGTSPEESTSTINSSEQDLNRNAYGLVKRYSHDLFLGDRPYVAPEFDFTLKELQGTSELLARWFFAPLVVLSIFLFRSRFRLSYLGGILFAAWLGLAFQRAVPYFNICVIFLVLPFYRDLGLYKRLKQAELNRFEWNTVNLFTAIILLVFFGVLSALLITSPIPREALGLSTICPGQMGLGKHSCLESKIPQRVLKEHPKERVYNQAYLGSLLLFEWWPHKKVAWWAKFSSFPTSVMKRRNNPTFALNIIEEYAINHVLTTTEAARKHRLFYENSERWQLQHRDHLIHHFARTLSYR